jgi:hypothetical protein
VSFPLDGIKFMVISGNERDAQTFCKSQRKGVGKGDVLLNFNDANPLDERIIGLSTEFEWQGEGVCPCCVGCGEPIITEEVIVDLSEITDMHSQEGGGQLNERLEHFLTVQGGSTRR